MLTEDLYTIREACELPGVRLKYWTLWDYLKKGRLTRIKQGGKTLIRRSELESLTIEVPKPRARRKPRSAEVGVDDRKAKV